MKLSKLIRNWTVLKIKNDSYADNFRLTISYIINNYSTYVKERKAATGETKKEIIRRSNAINKTGAETSRCVTTFLVRVE